jgi:hypothetical protein
MSDKTNLKGELRWAIDLKLAHMELGGTTIKEPSQLRSTMHLHSIENDATSRI